MYKRQSPNFRVSRQIVARPPPSEDVLEKKRSDREWAFQMQSYNNVIKKHVGRPATQYIIIDKNKVKPRHVGRTLDEIRKQVKQELLGKRYISPQYLQMQSEINARARGDGPRNRKSGSGDSVVDTSSTLHKSVEISIAPSEMNLFKNKRNQKTIDQIHEEVSPEEKEKALLPQLNKQMHMSIRRGARRSRPLKQVSGSGGCWNMDDTNSPLKSVEISIDTSKMKLLKNKRNQKTIDQIHEEVSPEEKEKALLPQLNKQMHKSIRRGARRSRPLKHVSGSGGCWNMDDTNSPLKSVEISIDTSKMKLLKPFQVEVTGSATALSPSSALAEPDTETPTQPLVPKEPIPEKRTDTETPTQPLVPKEPIPEKRTVAETPTQPLVPKEPIPEKRTDTEIQLSTAADEIVPHVEDVPAQTQELEEGEIVDDDEQAPNMGEYFRQMRKIVGREKISSRIRSFQDRMNLRTNKVKPRHVGRTLDEIRKEVKQELLGKRYISPQYLQMQSAIRARDRQSGPPDQISVSIDPNEMNLFKPYQAEVMTSSPPALPEEPIPEKTTDTEIQLSTAADEIVPHVEDVPAQTQELEEGEIVDDDEQVVSWWKIGGAAMGAGLVVYAGYCIIKKLTN